MEALWAPWRMEFIMGEEEGECIFCAKPKRKDPRESLILGRGKHSYVILNRYPYTNGHLMVVPYRHTVDLGGLRPEETLEIHELMGKSLQALREELHPDGFNLGVNLGKAAGAGIVGHLHHHVVPRWTGDTNFMPVIAETRSMPEHLHVTYDRLEPHFA